MLANEVPNIDILDIVYNVVMIQTTTHITTHTLIRPAFRHHVQTYRWDSSEWDIAALIAEIDAKVLVPMRSEVGRSFIEKYATESLALDRARTASNQKISFCVDVDLKVALELPDEALEEPLLFLETDRGKGHLRRNGSAQRNHIVADGQHRIAKAYFTDVQVLPIYLLTAAQSRRFQTK